MHDSWEHLSGSKMISTLANYTVPYPGSVIKHTMSLYDDKLYVFGGEGHDASSIGMDEGIANVEVC